MTSVRAYAHTAYRSIIIAECAQSGAGDSYDHACDIKEGSDCFPLAATGRPVSELQDLHVDLGVEDDACTAPTALQRRRVENDNRCTTTPE